MCDGSFEFRVPRFELSDRFLYVTETRSLIRKTRCFIPPNWYTTTPQSRQGDIA